MTVVKAPDQVQAALAFLNTKDISDADWRRVRRWVSDAAGRDNAKAMGARSKILRFTEPYYRGDAPAVFDAIEAAPLSDLERKRAERARRQGYYQLDGGYRQAVKDARRLGVELPRLPTTWRQLEVRKDAIAL